jgi:chorismate-pyruvate lyase
MSYQTLIDTNLNKAFNSIKDLAVTVTLTKKINPTFNFGASVTEISSTQTITTKAVVSELENKTKGRNTLEKQLMLKSKEVGDINAYSTITIDSQVWNVGEVLKGNGFIIVVNIYKET